EFVLALAGVDALGEVLARLFSPWPPPHCVDVRVHDGSADVPLRVLLAPHPRPARGRLGERGLDDVLGRVAIAGQQVGEPQEGGRPRGNERPEVVLVGAIHRLAPLATAVMHLRTRSRVRGLPTSPFVPAAGRRKLADVRPWRSVWQNGGSNTERRGPSTLRRSCPETSRPGP